MRTGEIHAKARYRKSTSHHLSGTGELHGDHGELLCPECHTQTPFHFAVSDGPHGFEIDCRNANCNARLIAFRSLR